MMNNNVIFLILRMSYSLQLLKNVDAFEKEGKACDTSQYHNCSKHIVCFGN